MAYDRFDPRRGPREERSRWNEDDRSSPRSSFERDRDERGWFERAGDEIASWFGDDDSGHRREAGRMPPRDRGMRMSDEDYDRFERRPQWRDEGYRRPYTGRFSSRQEGGPERGERDYRPLTGDYGRSSGDERLDRPAAGSPRHDRHYHQWRARQIDALDRDYDEFARENQSRFEQEFSSWREQRQQKRSLLSSVREHMAVVGSDGEPVGTVDRSAGDRLVLTKSDEAAGGSHHSLPCTLIDRIEDDRVVLAATAAEARRQWRDDDRQRALFERDDQGEAGPHMLNRSFSGTY